MTFHELNQSYFAWMCQLVSNERYSKRLSYRKLLTHLHEVEFTYGNTAQKSRRDTARSDIIRPWINR